MPSSSSNTDKEPAGRHRGFTLVELLVVVAILALLAALVIPAVQGAMQTSARIQCSHQLGQLFQGIMLYAVDNDNRYPPSWGPYGAWDIAVSPMTNYFGGAQAMQKLAVCPLRRGKPNDPVSNPYGCAYPVNYNVLATATAPTNPTAVRVSAIRNPVQTVLMADSSTTATAGLGFSDPSYPTFQRVGAPHSGKANILWCDGHVSCENTNAITSAAVLP